MPRSFASAPPSRAKGAPRERGKRSREKKVFHTNPKATINIMFFFNLYRDIDMMLMIFCGYCGKGASTGAFVHIFSVGFLPLFHRAERGVKRLILCVFEIVFKDIVNNFFRAASRREGKNGGKGCDKWGGKRWISTPCYGLRGGVVFDRLLVGFCPGYAPVFNRFLGTSFGHEKLFLRGIKKIFSL